MKRRLRFLCSVALLLLAANLCFANSNKRPQPDKATEKAERRKEAAGSEEKIVRASIR